MVYRASAGGGGSGSGTVNSGTAPQIAFYATTGTAVSGATGVNTNTVSPGIAIVGGTVTASSNTLNITQTWNDGAVTFVGNNIAITATAAAAASKALNVTYAGNTVFNVRLNNTITTAQLVATSGYYFTSVALADSLTYTEAKVAIDLNLTGLYLASDQGVGWATATNLSAFTKDTGISRVAAGVTGVGNGTVGNVTGYQQWGGQSRVTADVSFVSTATLANVTGLTAPVTSGRTYQFECVLYTTANVAGGIKAAVNATAAATFVRYEGYSMHVNTLLGQTRATAVGTAVAATTTAIAATVFICGTITPSATGNFTVQAAQNATTASATVILAGSYLKVFDTP